MGFIADIKYINNKQHRENYKNDKLHHDNQIVNEKLTEENYKNKFPSNYARILEYEERREKAWKKGGIIAGSIIGGAALIASIYGAYLFPRSKEPVPISPTTEITQEIQETTPEITYENSYGPIFFSIARPGEMEENVMYNTLTPSQLEQITLGENSNLKLNQVFYSVSKATDVDGNKFIIYNPILTDDKNDGNLYMTEEGKVYRLYPDNERSDDNTKLMKRLWLKVDLEYILRNSDLIKGQLVVNIMENYSLNSVDRKQQNTIIIYAPDSNDVLVPHNLKSNSQFWQDVDQEPYTACGNTKDSYKVHGQNPLPPPTATTTTTKPPEKTTTTTTEPPETTTTTTTTTEPPSITTTTEGNFVNDGPDCGDPTTPEEDPNYGDKVPDF